MSEGFTFFEGSWYASPVDALVSDAREHLVGTLFTYTANGCPMPRVGDEVTISLEGGVDLVCRVDQVGEGSASGAVVDARKTPVPTDWDDAGMPIAWDT